MVRSRPSRNTVPPSYASNNSRSGGSTGSDDSQPVPGTTEQPLEIMETVPEERPNTSSEPASARPASASARPPIRGPPSKRTKVESSSSAGMDSCTVEMGPRVSSQSASSASRTRPRIPGLVYTNTYARMLPNREPTAAELDINIPYPPIDDVQPLRSSSGLLLQHHLRRLPLHTSRMKNLMMMWPTRRLRCPAPALDT